MLYRPVQQCPMAACSQTCRPCLQVMLDVGAYLTIKLPWASVCQLKLLPCIYQLIVCGALNHRVETRRRNTGRRAQRRADPRSGSQQAKGPAAKRICAPWHQCSV